MKKIAPIIYVASVAFLVIQSTNVSAENSPLPTLACMLAPSEKVEISSPVSGVLDRVLVRRGDKIKKGQRLLELKAGVEKEGVKLATVKAAFAQRKTSRNKELFDENILTAHERDEIETELLIAKSELRLKEQELALRKIYRSINGVVVNRFYSKGEYVNVDPIFTLATLDPLHVDLLLPSIYFGEISLKQDLLIKPESEWTDAIIAKVIIVDPLIDSASSTFRVQLMMRNPGNKIPAGIRCSAQKINKD